mmetsp:Transcript_1231/g.2910  ORF Transcript_1231/g.2910 Transcript_1231/m.2910 type:complete len:86 (-) Transcript_1231:368-625(-)
MGRHSAWDEIDEAADFRLPLPFRLLEMPLIGIVALIAIIVTCVFSAGVPAPATSSAALHFTPVGPPAMKPTPSPARIDQLFSLKP